MPARRRNGWWQLIPQGIPGWPLMVAGFVIAVFSVVAPLASSALTWLKGGQAAPVLSIEPTGTLLVRSLCWAAIPALAATLIGWGIGIRLRRASSIARWLSLAVPLLPPYALFYSLWHLVPPGSWIGDWALTSGASSQLRLFLLALTLALWGWPIAAWSVYLCRARVPQVRAEMLDLDGARCVARLRAAWREDRAALCISWVGLTIYLLGDTTVFDVAQVRTVGFELRAMDSLGANFGQVMQVGTGITGLILVGVAVLFTSSRWGTSEQSGDARHGVGATQSARPTSWWIVALGVVTIAPLAVMAANLSRSGAGDEFLAFELGASLNTAIMAIIAGILCAAVGVGHFALASSGARGRTIGMLSVMAWLVMGCLPATVVALAHLHAWGSSPLQSWLSSSPLGVALAECSRFGFLAALVGQFLGCAGDRQGSVQEQVAMDPLDLTGFCRSMRPELVLVGASSFLLGTTLSALEVTIATRLQPPGFPMIASSLLNAIHYQDVGGVLLALPMLAAIVLVVAAVFGLGWARMTGRPLLLLLAIALGALSGCGSGDQSDVNGTGPVALDPQLVFGAPGRVPGRFEYPRAIDISPLDGSIVVVDKAAQVQVFSPMGQLVSHWRMPEWEMGKPTGVSIDKDGNIWVADTHYHRVICFSPSGTELLRIGSYGHGPGQFVYPTDVVFLPDGTLLVSEYGGNDRIQCFDRSGKILRHFGTCGRGEHELARPQSMSLSTDGTELFIADACNHRIQVFGIDGNWRRSLGSMGRASGELAYPYSVHALDDGSVLVSEFGNNRLQQLDGKSGRSLGEWGGVGAERGRLVTPWAVAQRGLRTAVLDSGNARVQVMEVAPWGVAVGGSR